MQTVTHNCVLLYSTKRRSTIFAAMSSTMKIAPPVIYMHVHKTWKWFGIDAYHYRYKLPVPQVAVHILQT